ncbi:MAG: thiamine pyrophosphate-binding protein [Gammaproteobacteria bacterium]|nr:thiamine pyrophosphate-binding protein [Gammaproteobacteria bacterium]
MLTTAQVMAKYLAHARIEYIFGYPGDPNLEFMEAARKEDIRFILARREGTAAFMADAYGQLTGLPGVCMSTLGPGSTNLVNGVACAFLDRTPMLAISGQMHTRLEPTFTHQNIDHVRLFAPVVKWATRMVPEAAGSIMRKAIRLTTAERPGPVHITTPINVGAAEAADSEIRLPPLHPHREWTEVFSTNDAGLAPVALIEQARRPIIVAGMATKRAGAGQALRAFVERTGTPVVVSPKAKGILPEGHPYYAGTLDMACNQLMWEFLGSGDLILAVGFDPMELIKSWSLRIPVVHIDATPNVDQVYPAELELVGSISAILQSLTDSCPGGTKWRESEIQTHRDALFQAYLQLAASLALGIVVIVFCDNTLHRIEVKQLRKHYPPVGTRFAPTDLVKLAQSMDCYGEHVEDKASLEAVLARANTLDRPLVIEARIDPSQYEAQF